MVRREKSWVIYKTRIESSPNQHLKHDKGEIMDITTLKQDVYKLFKFKLEYAIKPIYY